jgi:AraC-like DNA-binding protein
MQYLAQWRMQLAATLLASPTTLAKIADDVGYGSEAAFSRAFKKIVGVAPATWRATRAGSNGRTPAR